VYKYDYNKNDHAYIILNTDELLKHIVSYNEDCFIDGGSPNGARGSVQIIWLLFIKFIYLAFDYYTCNAAKLRYRFPPSIEWQ
jgi:hypothetical protein